VSHQIFGVVFRHYGRENVTKSDSERLIIILLLPSLLGLVVLSRC